MTTITLNKSNFDRTTFLDEKDLFLYIIDYFQNIKDVEDVKNEIANDNGYRISLNDYIKNV